MLNTPRRIRITANSTIFPLLEEAANQPLLLEKDGVVYRLEREVKPREDIWSRYDPEAALEGIEAAAGSWKDIDPEEFKAFIYRAREEGSRPLDRP